MQFAAEQTKENGQKKVMESGLMMNVRPGRLPFKTYYQAMKKPKNYCCRNSALMLWTFSGDEANVNSSPPAAYITDIRN